MDALNLFIDLVLDVAPSDPQVIAAIAAVSAFTLSAIAISWLLASRSLAKYRMRSIDYRRGVLRDFALEGKDNDSANRRQDASKYTLLVRLAKVLRLGNLVDTNKLRNWMNQAGWHDPAATYLFLVAHVLTPFFTSAIAAMFTENGDLAMTGGPRYLVIAVAALFGLALPGLILRNTIQKRQEKLNQQYPEVLDLLLVCVEAGLSTEAAFQRVTNELTGRYPEVAEELRLVTAELNFLNNPTRAFKNIAERVPTDSFKSLASTLIQAESYGTPLSNSLRALAESNRKYREQLIREQAGKLDAKMSVPLILFILPALLTVVLGPAAVELMQS